MRLVGARLDEVHYARYARVVGALNGVHLIVGTTEDCKDVIDLGEGSES